MRICISLLRSIYLVFFQNLKNHFLNYLILILAQIEISNPIINSKNSESSICGLGRFSSLVVAAPFSYFYEGRTDNVR